jgi:hypothetical protein
MKQRTIRVGGAALAGILVLLALALALQPAQVDAQDRLPPVQTRLAPLRITPIPQLEIPALRSTPVAPEMACIHLTSDGAPASGSVGGRVAQRCFAFSASAGDMATILILAGQGGAMPPMELRGPDGVKVASSSNGEIKDQPLPAAGLYTVILSGAGMARTALVQVAVTVAGAGAGDALCGGTLIPGVDQYGIVPFPGETCHFSFYAQRGQSVGVRMESMTPDLAPDLLLLDPDGNILSAGTPLNGGTVYASGLDLPADGVYTAVAGSAYGQSAGAFRLLLRPAQAGACGSVLTLGQPMELYLPADEMACDLQFVVPEGQWLAATAESVDGGWPPGWLILAPDGSVAAYDQDSTWVAEPGLYTLHLGTMAGQAGRVLVEVGPARMVYYHIVTACGGNLVYGISPGSKPFTVPTGGACLFNFTGAAGDKVWVAVSRAASGSAFDPVIELIQPGASTASAPEVTAYSGQAPGMAVLRDHSLARTGRYTVRVSDYNNDDSGDIYIMVWKRYVAN